MSEYHADKGSRSKYHTPKDLAQLVVKYGTGLALGVHAVRCAGHMCRARYDDERDQLMAMIWLAKHYYLSHRQPEYID